MLDAKYEKADNPAIIEENCTHLKDTEQQQLLRLLQEFEELFDGTLGEWNASPTKLQLKPGICRYMAGLTQCQWYTMTSSRRK